MAILAQPSVAASGLEVMVARYNCCGWPWLRKHSAADTATPPGELDEAQQKASKAVLKSQWTAQITIACFKLIAVLYFIVIRAINLQVRDAPRLGASNSSRDSAAKLLHFWLCAAST